MSAAATALVLTTALPGCTLQPDAHHENEPLAATGAVDDPHVTAALSKLASRIDEISEFSYVGAEYTPRVEDAPHAIIEVLTWVELSPDLVDKVVSAVLEMQATPAFEGVPINFNLGSDDTEHIELDLRDFDAARVAADVEYWAQVHAVYGPGLSMRIEDESMGFPGPYTRLLWFEGSESVEWDELRGIPDTGAPRPIWIAPGVDATGELPTAEELALLDEMTEIWPPLLAETLRGVNLEPGPGDELQVSVFSGGIFDEEDATRSEDWPAVVELAETVVASPQDVDGFRYRVGQYAGGSLRLDACAVEVQTAPRDDDFVSALEGHGVDLPDGVEPGFCEVSPYFML
jgi:hypothetical protein